MLLRIDRIKNLGVFENFSWNAALAPFRRYNLIFGWNGSGKTTLSRLFATLESGATAAFPELEYQLTIEDKKLSNKDPLGIKVRTFNSDYVERNVRIVEARANPIYILGEKSQATLNEIAKDEVALFGQSGDPANPGKIELRRRAQADADSIAKQIDNTFTQLAKTISAAWTAGGISRTYRRPNAEAAYTKLSKSYLLTDTELAERSAILTQAPEPTLDLVPIPSVDTASGNAALDDAIAGVIAQSISALASKIQNVAISRLVENKDISSWVEEGVAIHEHHSSSACEFCGQALPAERLAALAAHFSDEDRKLKARLNSLHNAITSIQEAIGRLRPHSEAELFKQFRNSYAATVTRLLETKNQLAVSLTQLAGLLQAKRSQTTESLACTITLNAGPLLTELQATNSILEAHNVLAANLGAAQERARSDIERHYLSTVREGVEAKQAQLEKLNVEISRLENGDPKNPEELGIFLLQKRIADNRAKVSSAHKSCDQLNEVLRSFFGRDDLSFEVETGADGKATGYQLRRGGEIARNVSEGERTAIAFAHFIIQLTEQAFSLKEGIVVVDDPISSLDSGALYKVCAAIEKQLSGAGQLFLLTHNMDFFNQMKKWFLNDPSIAGAEDDAADCKSRFLMIRNAFNAESGKRVAMLSELDPMLRDYESEYHFLFKQLFNFDVDNPEPDGAALRVIYNYPNIARKLLECFVAYRVPIRRSFYTRLYNLKKVDKNIDGADIKFVYNFVNSHSHLDTKMGLLQFDATLAVNGREAIRRTLALIEAADPFHYKFMRSAVKK